MILDLSLPRAKVSNAGHGNPKESHVSLNMNASPDVTVIGNISVQTNTAVSLNISRNGDWIRADLFAGDV